MWFVTAPIFPFALLWQRSTFFQEERKGEQSPPLNQEASRLTPCKGTPADAYVAPLVLFTTLFRDQQVSRAAALENTTKQRPMRRVENKLAGKIKQLGFDSLTRSEERRVGKECRSR